MKRFFLIGLTFVLVTLPVIVCAQRNAQAAGRLASAHDAYDRAIRDAEEIIDLRSKQQTINAAQRPPQDVIALVNSTLASVGIPSNRLQNLFPESDSTLASGNIGAGPAYKLQSIRLTLEGLSVQEIGAFLSEWRASQQVWTPSRIELNHVRKQDENCYNVTIVLSAIYIAES